MVSNSVTFRFICDLLCFYHCFYFYISGESRKAFENLKKRYSKKRSQLKQAKRSGAGKVDVDSYQKELDKYAFLQWLEPFIRLRNDTRTNLPKKEEVKRQEDTEDQMECKF